MSSSSSSSSSSSAPHVNPFDSIAPTRINGAMYDINGKVYVFKVDNVWFYYGVDQNQWNVSSETWGPHNIDKDLGGMLTRLTRCSGVRRGDKQATYRLFKFLAVITRQSELLTHADKDHFLEYLSVLCEKDELESDPSKQGSIRPISIGIGMDDDDDDDDDDINVGKDDVISEPVKLTVDNLEKCLPQKDARFILNSITGRYDIAAIAMGLDPAKYTGPKPKKRVKAVKGQQSRVGCKFLTRGRNGKLVPFKERPLSGVPRKEYNPYPLFGVSETEMRVMLLKEDEQKQLAASTPSSDSSSSSSSFSPSSIYPPPPSRAAMLEWHRKRSKPLATVDDWDNLPHNWWHNKVPNPPVPRRSLLKAPKELKDEQWTDIYRREERFETSANNFLQWYFFSVTGLPFDYEYVGRVICDRAYRRLIGGYTKYYYLLNPLFFNKFTIIIEKNEFSLTVTLKFMLNRFPPVEGEPIRSLPPKGHPYYGLI